VFHFDYTCAYRYGVLPLRETAAEYEPQQSLSKWSDEQLAHVRLVLQRLTALRIENADDGEDLVQETLLTMTMKSPQEELKKGLMVWSMGILRKKIGNYYRKAQRDTALDENVTARRKPGPPSPEDRARYSELLALVQRTVAGLPPQERQVMDLLLAGLPASRIADLLYPERYQNIINRLYRGKHKLQKELAKHGYGLPVKRSRQ
jgi:RNA polymerase sigma factor (sigma-70 family)